MAGIAVLMIVSQIPRATGIPVASGNVIQEVASAIRHLPEFHLPTLLLSGGVLIVLFVLHRFAPTWPGPLIAMVAAAIVVAVFDLTAQGGSRWSARCPPAFRRRGCRIRPVWIRGPCSRQRSG